MHFLLVCRLYILIHPIDRMQLEQKLHLNARRLHFFRLFYLKEFLSDYEEVTEVDDVAGVLIDCFVDDFSCALHERVYCFKGI